MYNMDNQYIHIAKGGIMTGVYNMRVAGENYGEGKITAWDGRTMTVRFENCEKRFWFPLVFTTGVLKPVSEKDNALIQEITERWKTAVFERELMSLGEEFSDEDVQEVTARICEIFRNAYSQEEVSARVEQMLEATGKAVSSVSEAKLQFTKESDFTGGAFANLGISLLTILATVFSLGIAYPFMMCWKLRWEVNHTIVDGQKLTFDGKGIQLFGKYIIWWLLSIVTFGIYFLIWMPLNVTRWQAKHTHFEGTTNMQSKFNGNVWAYFGLRLLTRLVKSVTLGIGSFWAHCFLQRWVTKHTSYDGYRLKFDGTGWQFFGKCIVWVLLTVVTLGIYGIWLAVKVKKWTASHTHVA